MSAPAEPAPAAADQNAFGTAGFVVSLISLFLGWIPFYGWIPWIAGAILSGIGLSRRPRAFAIAGIVLSGMTLLVIILIFAIMVITAGATYEHAHLLRRLA